jgi:hypothetical protein
MQRSLRPSVRYFPKAIRGHKYPFLVSYHQLPWMVVEPGSTRFHETVGEHYASMLDLVSKSFVTAFVQNDHPSVPVDRWLHLLPSTVYALPVSGTRPLNEWAPFGWDGVDVTEDQHKTAHYGSCHRDYAHVLRVVEFTSPDLRLCCNAVAFRKPHCTASPSSSLQRIDEGGSNGEFVVFQFYRPNRSPSELVTPLERFYVHRPDLSMLPGGKGWEPKTQKPKTSGTAKPMTFKPPICYQLSLPERLGVRPGDAFGRRDLMWGYWM